MSSSQEASTLRSLDRVHQESFPYYKRLIYSIRVYILKRIFNLLIRLFLKSPKPGPTYTKSFPVLSAPNLSKLKHRIFIPASHQPGEIHPLIISLHWGGFVLGSPIIEDGMNLHFSQNFDFVVVSLQYPLWPSKEAGFPKTMHSVVNLIEEVFKDKDLPVDRKRVTIMGTSAGASLALSISQLPAMKGKIHAIVPFYPPTDWTLSTEQRIATRTFNADHSFDSLTFGGALKLFKYAYVPAGQDLKDPILSPIFAKRNAFPRAMMVVSAEFDCLGDESRRMMIKLVREADGDFAEHDDAGERKYEACSRDGLTRWRMARSVDHGFTSQFVDSGNVEMTRKKVTAEVLHEVGMWLKDVMHLDSMPQK